MRNIKRTGSGRILVGALALSLSACAFLGDSEDTGRVEYPLDDPGSWRGDPRFWTVEEGLIIGESTAENPCDKTTYLVWDGEELTDFELTFQYRIKDGNSGVQFRSREVAEFDVHGYQADLDAQNQWTGCLYEQGGRGVVATRGQRVAYDGAQRSVAPFPGQETGSVLTVAELPGWNDYRVRAVGSQITFEVNGVKTIELFDGSAEAARAGILALQMHQGPPMRVEYRNLVLHRLPASETADAAGAEAPTWLDARRWIWSGAVTDHEEIWCRTTFELTEEVKSASLWGTCDNAMQVYLNGNEVVISDRWEQPVLVDVASELRSGSNQLCVWGRNETGPGGLVLELTIETDSGTRKIATDKDWIATSRDPGPDWTLVERNPPLGSGGWFRAVEYGAYGTAPWGTLGAGKAPEPDMALAASEIELPDGFEAELLYSVPRIRYGSWVSLCAADDGRLYASDQYGGMYRITLEPTVAVEPLELEVGRAHGLLWAFDALYVVVSEGGGVDSGLYRLTDSDRDDELDRVEHLASFAGTGEHGPHAVVLAPDGESLYIVAGNHVDLPEIEKSRVTPVWAEDVLLERLDDPNGHAVGKLAPGGWVVRTDKDATSFELVASGFRNAYDLAFDQHGELFTFDSDMEWDIGLPWYRPTRILHVVSGAEFGWRAGSGKWPESYPDSLPTTVDIGLSSPTGIVMGTGAAFPKRWRDTLFAADWAYGTIYAVQLERRGSSFGGTSEVFAQGAPLPVTDLTVGSDGFLYFTTGGRRAQSGLYRVKYVEPYEAEEEAPEPLYDEDYVATRQSLESYHGEASLGAIEAAWPELSHKDRNVRFAARTAIESQDPRQWRARALAEGELQASIEALLALIRCDETLTSGEVLARIGAWHWEAMSPEQRIAATRVLGLSVMRIEGAERDAADLAQRLLRLLPTGADHADRELARLLGRLDVDGLAPVVLDLLEAANSQEAAIHYAYVASSLSKGWNDATRARMIAWFDQGSREYSGGVSFRQYIDAMRSRAVAQMGESFVVEAALVSGDEYAPRRGEKFEFVRDYTVDDLASALERVDKGRDFERGKDLFRQTTCLQCHRIDQEGGGTGPDLTGTAGRYSARDLLDSILNPSSVVSDQYRDEEVWLTNGNVAVGRVVSDVNGLLTVREASGQKVEIDSEEIDLRREHPLSRMPEGLIDVLSEEDVLDLLAFVLAGGDPADEAYSAPAGD